MSAQATANADKKAKRNKIVLVVLAAVLGVILLIQGPTLLSAFGGGGSDEAADDAETELTESAAPPISIPQPVAISDSDVPQEAGLAGLSTLSRFSQDFTAFDALVIDTGTDESGSDPTSDQPSGDAPVGDSGSTPTGSGSESSAPDGSGDTSTGDTATGDTSTGDDGSAGTAPSVEGDSSTGGNSQPDADPNNGIFTSGSGAIASLAINDITQDVVVGTNFPSSNPVFKLVMIDGNAINVGLVNGAFSTGTTTIDVDLGESRTLVSQPDGTRYRVKYLGRQGG